MVCSSSQFAVHFLENLAEHGAGARPVLRMSRSRGGVQVRFARLNSRLVELRFLNYGLRGSGLGDRATGTFQVSLRFPQSVRVLCFFGGVSPGRGVSQLREVTRQSAAEYLVCFLRRSDLPLEGLVRSYGVELLR